MLESLADRAEVARGIEVNAAALLLMMGRAGGGEEYRDANIHWTIGGSPIDYHNAVVRADLTDANADAAIDGVIGKFREHNVPGSWHLTEAMTPRDLGERLVAHGFVSGGSEPGMAVDLRALNEQSAPDDLHIEQVRDEAGLQAWARTLATGFGEGEREANWVRDVYLVIGLGDESPFRHYVAWQAEKPVATASLFMGWEHSGDLLRDDRAGSTAAGDWRGDHAGGAEGGAGIGVSRRGAWFVRGGVCGVPAAWVRGILQDRDLRVART